MRNFKFVKIKEIHKLSHMQLMSILAIGAIVVLSALTYFIYDDYRATIIYQQQRRMLETSRSIARSTELFITDIQDSVKIITSDSNFNDGTLYKERLKAYYEAKKDVIDKVYFFNTDGEILDEYPKDKQVVNSSLRTDINTVISMKKSYIGKTYLEKSSNGFLLNVYEPVFHGKDFKGVIAVSISLESIYNKLISPLQIGEKGYAMMKDEAGIIIMHPVKEQIGMDVIESRKQAHPDLNFEELEKLIKDQITGKEGTAIYHSYWWGDNVLKKVKKFSAYTPVQVGDHFWIIALTLSYDEVQKPINEFLFKIIGIAIIIIVIIYIFILALIKMKNNKEELEKQAKKLKTLREASEQRRKEESELYHSHKLKIIGTLAGGIAHDINNLLTPILGYSELLLMRMPKESEYYDEVDEIYKASEKGKDLIEQLLIFSRNDSGIIKVSPININTVTRETIKLIKVVLPKKVIIKESIKENCGYINANFTQIHQVIFNLCTNAYQSIKNNGGTIEVSLDTVEGIKINGNHKSSVKGKKYVEIKVADTGCGMDEETKTRIFEPFFTTKDIDEGTGLGLFVVQSIIDKYKGIIEVYSELGKGSCFKVYFPLVSMESKIDNVIFKENSNNGKKILIVDDNEDITKLLKKSLEGVGYNVITENDSIKALKLFEANYEEIDLVITDYMMPNLNGGELAIAIKEIKPKTGVILMTGYIKDKENLININDFIDEYITKPIKFNNLCETIEKVLE